MNDPYGFLNFPCLGTIPKVMKKRKVKKGDVLVLNMASR